MRSRGASGPAGWLRKGSAPKREEGREQRKERREKREERKWPQARFTAFLQGPILNNSNSTDRVCERPWAGGMAPKRVGP